MVFELLTVLRDAPQFAGVPVAMLTSKATERYRARALALGADDYLIKPCPDDELLAACTVQRLVAKAPNTRLARHASYAYIRPLKTLFRPVRPLGNVAAEIGGGARTSVSMPANPRNSAGVARVNGLSGGIWVAWARIEFCLASHSASSRRITVVISAMGVPIASRGMSPHPHLVRTPPAPAPAPDRASLAGARAEWRCSTPSPHGAHRSPAAI